MEKRIEVDGIPVYRTLEEALPLLANDTEIGLDIETTGLNPYRDSIATVQLYGADSGTALLYQVPARARAANRLPKNLLDFLADSRARFIAHNGVNFDLIFLGTHGVPFWGMEWFDTLIAEAVVVGADRKNVSKRLGDSIRRRLGTEVKKDMQHGHWADELTPEQIDYAIRDVLALPPLKAVQIEKAGKQHEGLLTEQALVPMTARMMYNGLPFDLEAYKGWYEGQIVARRVALMKLQECFGGLGLNKIKEAPRFRYVVDEAGKRRRVAIPEEERAAMMEPESLDSDDVDFHKLKYNPRANGQTKALFESMGFNLSSTDTVAMHELTFLGGQVEQAAQMILDFRGSDHRIAHYGLNMVQAHYEKDNRLHGGLIQMGTNTTRYSSKEPNLQNMPGDSRYIFGNESGKKCVKADYSQIEMIIAAYEFQDEALMKSLEFEDIHRANASALFHVAYEAVEKAQRKSAKGVSFGLLFGGGAGAYQRTAHKNGMNATIEEAEKFRALFLQTFRGVAAAIARATDTVARAKRQGSPVFVHLPGGIYRMVQGADLKPTVLINTKIQGTAARGLKFALIEVSRREHLARYTSSTVHDEIVAFPPEEVAVEFGAELRAVMLDGMKQAKNVPARVEVDIANTWAGPEYDKLVEAAAPI